ncbi:MAG: AlpA family phage regulatory protein [Pseudomonadota bacterium]
MPDTNTAMSTGSVPIEAPSIDKETGKLLGPARKVSWCIEMTGLSEPTIYRLVKANKFPSPFYVSDRSPRWVESEVKAWMAAKIAERDGAAA